MATTMPPPGTPGSAPSPAESYSAQWADGLTGDERRHLALRRLRAASERPVAESSMTDVRAAEPKPHPLEREARRRQRAGTLGRPVAIITASRVRVQAECERRNVIRADKIAAPTRRPVLAVAQTGRTNSHANQAGQTSAKGQQPGSGDKPPGEPAGVAVTANRREVHRRRAQVA